MCLIVDNCVASRVLVHRDDSFFGNVSRCLFSGCGVRVRLSYGGELLAEYSGSQDVLSAIQVLEQAGRASKTPDSAIRAEKRKVEAAGGCGSNDAHVLALARASGARILCSNDNPLIQDFKNPAIIGNPAGKVITEERLRKNVAAKPPTLKAVQNLVARQCRQSA